MNKKILKINLNQFFFKFGTMLNEENIDFILTNSSFSEIQRKRIKKELHQISTFHDPSIKLAIVTPQSGLIIKVVSYLNS